MFRRISVRNVIFKLEQEPCYYLTVSGAHGISKNAYVFRGKGSMVGDNHTLAKKTFA